LFLRLDRFRLAQYVFRHGVCFPNVGCLGRAAHNLWLGTVHAVQPTFNSESRHLIHFHRQPYCLGHQRMSSHQPSQGRSQSWLDFVTLGLMSIAAPGIAAFIHSLWVFHTGIRFYNAQVWGLDGFWSVVSWIGACGVPAIPTFLVLLPFRRRALYRWLVWVGFIILWTWFFFATEFAKH